MLNDREKLQLERMEELKEKIKLEERVKQLDDQLQEKKLILLRGLDDQELACKIRYDMREIEKESNELLHKMNNDQY